MAERILVHKKSDMRDEKVAFAIPPAVKSTEEVASSSLTYKDDAAATLAALYFQQPNATRVQQI
jgi:hypothetical protein